MMLKIFAGLIWGVLVCGLVIAALFLVLNFDFLKPQIEAQAAVILQQKVQINGDIKPGVLGWRPALVLHEVDIGAKVKADTVALTMQDLRSSQEFFVHVDGLKFKDLLLGNYDIPLTIQPTGFEAYPLKGELDGAAFAGEVKYIDNKLHIDGILKNISLGKFAVEAQGNVDVKIQLDGKGNDEAQLIHTLAGRFMLTGGAGRLTNKSLNFWSRGLLSSLLPAKKAETKLNCAIIDFKIVNGIALSSAIVVDTDENTVFGKGRIDLDKGQLDMLFKPNPKDMSLVSLATPVHVTGPVDAVVVTPEAGGMAKKIGGILLSVVNPALALIPLMETGLGDYNGTCAEILKQNQPKNL